MDTFHNSNFNNRDFWKKRYDENPELGSGIGSRGKVASDKKMIVKSILDRHSPKSILDIGCGNMKILEDLNIQGYTGIDLAENIISKNCERFPNLFFLTGDFLQLSQKFQSSFELVLCFDVLIHQHDYLEYNKFVKGLVNATIKIGLISGYDNMPDMNHRSEITAYHEPITTTLRKCSIKNTKIISTINQVSFLLFFK